MLLIEIHGLKNGNHHVELNETLKKSEKFPEFNSNINVTGNLKIFEDKMIFTGNAVTMADLICDVSLKDYQEEIEAELEILILKGASPEEIDEDRENTVYVGEDEKSADITEIVLEELVINIPMKKVAPQFRGKELDEIYPELFDEEEESKGIEGSPWEKLKKLK